MSERLNKTSICSIAFIDIVEYSKKSVSEQIECKERFNRLLSDALKDVAQNDRIILDTGDGAAIAFLGSPEDALFVSLTIRDTILADDGDDSVSSLQVRIGINLGPVRVVKDINNQLNIIGDGINVAQRVVGFAEHNQILVSRSYYEIVSRLSDEITEMFAYFGIKQDKHVREHEVYVIRSPADAAMAANQEVSEAAAAAKMASNKARIRIAALCGSLAVIVGGLLFVAAKPRTAVNGLEPAVAATAPAASTAAAPVAVAAEQAKESAPKAAGKPKKAHKHTESHSTTQAVAVNKPTETETSRQAEPQKSAQREERVKPAQPAQQQSNSVSFCSEAQRMLRQCS